MRLLIFVTLNLLFSNVDYGQCFMDKYRIHKALKFMMKGEYVNAEEKFNKIRGEILESDSTLYFKYQYLFESFDKYIDKAKKYPPSASIGSLKDGLASINNLINQWDGGVDRDRIKNKYSLKRTSLKDIHYFFDSKVNAYNDSLRRIEVRDSLERIRQDSLDLILREKHIQDSLVNLAKFEIPNASKKLLNDISPKTITEKFGKKKGQALEMEVTIERDSLNKVYKFSLKYDEATFKPGSYKGKHTDYIISKMFEQIKAEIGDFEILMLIRGTADATKPRGNKYKNELDYPISRKVEVNGENINMSISKNNKISNLEIAFLRAYNAEILFREIVHEEVDRLIAIDYLREPDLKKGDDYRTVAFVLVINNFYEDVFNSLSQENFHKLINEDKAPWGLRTKNGEIDFIQPDH